MKFKDLFPALKDDKGRSSSVDALEKSPCRLYARSSYSLPRSTTDIDEELLTDVQTYRVVSGYQVKYNEWNTT